MSDIYIQEIHEMHAKLLEKFELHSKEQLELLRNQSDCSKELLELLKIQIKLSEKIYDRLCIMV